jgi:SAM-dependent methyltransferase
MDAFCCNICSWPNAETILPPDRENSSCHHCGSNVRLRGLLYALSLELFGTALTLPDFPRIKSIRGLGTSDSNSYALMLGDRLDYRNTFFDREPKFDVTNPPAEEFGKYDFITSSEVFEHVLPPVENAFRNCRDLLRENGVLVFTMPYSIEPESLEHYPDLHQFGFAEVAGEKVLVNRTAAGDWQVFENPVFHRGITGNSLEVREMNETALRGVLAAAGFDDVRIYSAPYPHFGVVQSEAWSLPIVARKGRFTLRPEAVLELLEEWKRLAEGKRNLQRSFWFRVGRQMGIFSDPASR